MDGFFSKVVMGIVAFGIVVWLLLRFVITYDAAMIRQKVNKLDGEVVMISGKVLESRFFEELPLQGVSYNAMRLKTRKGEIWIATLKDKPSVGAKYFMEVEVMGSINTVNKRFQMIRPLDKNAPLGSKLPFLLEKNRIGLPFTI